MTESSFADGLLAARGAVQYDNEDLVQAIKKYDARRRPTVEEFSEIMLALVAAKSPEWSYEQEYRLISNEPGLHRISKNALRAVCFGLRATPEIKDEVRRVIAESGYAFCMFFEMVQSTDRSVIKATFLDFHAGRW